PATRARSPKSAARGTQTGSAERPSRRFAGSASRINSDAAVAGRVDLADVSAAGPPLAALTHRCRNRRVWRRPDPLSPATAALRGADPAHEYLGPVCDRARSYGRSQTFAAPPEADALPQWS